MALIEATIASLKRYGHEGLSVRRISAEAGVSIGLINHHFPNKNVLVAEAFRHFNRMLGEVMRQAVEQAPPEPRARLRALFEATFSPPNLTPEVLSAWVVFWGLHRHSPEIRAVHEEVHGGYLDLPRRLLEDLEKLHGRLRYPARLAAIGLTAMLDGLWLEWCLDPDNFSPKEAVTLCEAWVDALCA